MDALAAVRVPVLQLAGGASPACVPARAPPPSTRGWPTGGSSVIEAPGTPPTTATPTRWPRARAHRLSTRADATAPRSGSGYHRRMSELAAAPADTRPYSPGLEGVDRRRDRPVLHRRRGGRLLYRGYPIGELVQAGSYAAVAELLWTGEWDPDAKLALPARARRRPDGAPRAAEDRQADGRAADRGLGVGRGRRPVVAADARRRRARSRRPRRRRSPPSRGSARGSSRSRRTPSSTSSPASCTRSTARSPTPRRRGRSTRTSSSARSTGSTPRPSPAA